MEGPHGPHETPETYPKFQKQPGKVVEILEMINWRIMNPLESDPLDADEPTMTALQAYIAQERCGTPMMPGMH